MLDNRKEKCGIYAISNCQSASFKTYLALHNLQHRGQEGCGIATLNDNEQIEIFKNEGLVESVFNNFDLMHDLKGDFAIGHVRYSTSGSKDLENVQPIFIRHSALSFALVHNGNISNQDDVRAKLEQKGSIMSSTSDTELIGHFILRYFLETNDLTKAIKLTCQELEGAFNCAVISRFGIHVFKDCYGFRPLVVAKTYNHYIFSSESCAISENDVESMQDVMPGEIYFVNRNNELVVDSYIDDKNVPNNICAMEFIYFARPDSTIHNHNVHKVRQQLGIELAKQLDFKAGVVVGVPDSSLSAASGFATQSNLSLEMGIVKNRYIARTFINPNANVRNQNLRKKFAINADVIKGQDIILVDDSIVRGSTMKALVELIKQYQPKSIRIVIASPKIFNPCFYGIDMSSKAELIANQMDEGKMAQYLGITSVDFLKLDTLRQVLKEVGICHACFSGEYLTMIKEK